MGVAADMAVMAEAWAAGVAGDLVVAAGSAVAEADSVAAAPRGDGR